MELRIALGKPLYVLTFIVDGNTIDALCWDDKMLAVKLLHCVMMDDIRACMNTFKVYEKIFCIHACMHVDVYVHYRFRRQEYRICFFIC
jgi:hypothetical protein